MMLRSIHSYRALLFFFWGLTTASSHAMEYRRESGIAYKDEGLVDAAMKSRCLIDIDYPADQKGFSTIIWFHGGGLTEGEREIPPALAGKGCAIVAPGYRLSPTVKAPAYIEDAAAAVAWTLKNIERFGGDPNRIVLSGGSAGGYLAHMVGLDKRWLAAHGIDAARIAGIAPLSGNTITHFTIRGERGIPPTQPVIDDLAPIYHIRADAPPILLVTGDRELELFGRYEENAYFWRMMKLVGHKDCTLHELGGFDHGGVFNPSFKLLLDFTNRVTKYPPKP